MLFSWCIVVAVFVFVVAVDGRDKEGHFEPREGDEATVSTFVAVDDIKINIVVIVVVFFSVGGYRSRITRSLSADIKNQSKKQGNDPQNIG